MKYEAVFGDQSLFDGASKEAVLVISDMTPCAPTIEFFEDDKLNFETADVDSRRLKVAMRRIIREPKRWTVEDQKAGRLPEVGCAVDTFTGGCVVIGADLNLKLFSVQYQDDECLDILHISKIKLIETPEEKAARLREEWCIKALSSCSISSGMQKYELKRLGGYIEDIYDALLSGELPMPSKDGE